MPYLRMFLDEQLIDEVFISEHLLSSVLGLSIIAEEKQRLTKKHLDRITKENKQPAFCIDAVLSQVNTFVSLKEYKP